MGAAPVLSSPVFTAYADDADMFENAKTVKNINDIINHFVLFDFTVLDMFISLTS